MIIRSLDEIYITARDEGLLVVDTDKTRVHAAAIILSEATGMESLTTPGTYFEHHLGGVCVKGTWPIERVATALADVFFRNYPDLHEKNMKMWRRLLDRAASNPSFEISD